MRLALTGDLGVDRAAKMGRPERTVQCDAEGSAYMFEWLEQEKSAIKTPRFHLVDGPAKGKLRRAILQSDFPLPQSYKEFVLKFGNAKLYHKVRYYVIEVFAGPREATLEDGTCIYHLGAHDGASVYVKSGFDSAEMPIFEFEVDEEDEEIGRAHV